MRGTIVDTDPGDEKQKRASKTTILVRAAGLEPAQAFRPYGFSYHFGFRRRPTQDVRGLDYTFTVAGVAALGAARLVSTPSRLRAWLGIAFAGFPDFEQFCIKRFRLSTQELA